MSQNNSSPSTRRTPVAHRSQIDRGFEQRMLPAINQICGTDHKSLLEFKLAMRKVSLDQRPLLDVTRQARLLTYAVRTDLTDIRQVNVEDVMQVTSEQVRHQQVIDQVGELLLMFGCVGTERLLTHIKRRMTRARFMHWGWMARKEARSFKRSWLVELVDA